jgi:hypothetical protein
MRETAVHAFLVFMFYICYDIYIYIYAVFILGNILYLHAASLHICTYPGAITAQYRSGLQAGWPGFDFWRGQDMLLFPTAPRRTPEAHTASHPMGKLAGAELPPSLTEVKNGELYLYSSISLQVMVLNYFNAGKILPSTFYSYMYHVVAVLVGDIIHAGKY